MRKKVLFLACSIIYGLASWSQLPKADVMDIVFNDDGTVTDVSAMQNPVRVMGSPHFVKSDQFGMNVLCQSDEQWGGYIPNYVRIDANEQLEAAIADGVTLETMVRPYFAGGVFNTSWVNLFGGFQGGGIGLLIDSGAYDFEGYINGGYKDAYSTTKPAEGEWIHLMGVWNKEEGVIKLYINGILEKTLNAAGDISFATPENRFYALGCDLDPGSTYMASNAFTGDIALARMYNDPLTDEEVAAIYADVMSKKTVADVQEHEEMPVLRTADDGTVLIANTEELIAFGRAVRLGETSLNAKLEADVAYSGKDKMLSTDDGYSGTFDGQGHTITMSITDRYGDDAALFKRLSGATIKNLTLMGDISTSGKFASGLAGHTTGNNKVNRVHSGVSIISTLEGDGTHGGFVGSNSSGTLTLDNCLFDGTIQGEATTHCAGMVGWSGGATYIKNSLLTATISTGEDNSYTFTRNPNNAQVTNSYYIYPYGTVNDGAIQLDEAQLSSGEACWLLNESRVSDNWLQTFSVDPYPIPQDGHGIVVGMDGQFQCIQDEASLKSVSEAYAAYLRNDIDQYEAYKPLIEQLQSDIDLMAKASSTEEFLSLNQTIRDDVADIETNMAAYADFAQQVESALAEIQDMTNPVALLLNEYLTESMEPNESYPNGSAIYIIENYSLSTEALEAETQYIKEMLQNAMSNDVPAGTEVTLLLANADFSQGDEGWDGTKASNYTYNPNAGQWYGVMEGTKTQTLTGLKNGIYEFRLNSFNMVGDDNYCSFYTGVIQANDMEIPVMSPMEDPVRTEDALIGENCYSDDRLVDEEYYIPYSRKGGAIAMAAGRYANSVLVEVTDGTLTVGAHLYGSGKNDDWFMFANARLYYQGTLDEAEDALNNVMAGALARAKTTLDYVADTGGNNYLYFPNYSQALRNELAAAVETAETAADADAKYAALVKLSDLFKQIYTCRKAYRQMAIDLITYYESIPDYPAYVDVIQANSDQAWDEWLAGSLTAEEALAKGEALLAELSTYEFDIPVPDLMDIVFNADGTATDISAAQNEVVTVGTPKIVMSPTLDKNVFCHTLDQLGSKAENYIKVIPSEAMLQGITDGLTVELYTRPYWTADEYANLSWATPLGMEDSGGFGLLVYNNQWCFEAHVGGGYKDVYSGSSPIVGEWVHLIGVWNQETGSLTLYVDGKLAGSINAIGSFGAPNVSQKWVGIGVDINGNSMSEASYKGDIAIARIYDKPVNAAQVDYLYKNVQAMLTGKPEHSESGEAVEDIYAGKPAEQRIYTITGVRVEKPTHGLYIINGKKVMIK